MAYPIDILTRLAAGGIDGAGYLSSAEIYDPAAGTWSPAASMSGARGGAAVAKLNGGKVLVAGGFGGQTRLVQQLVAFQHPLLVPRRAVQGEGQPGPGPLAGVTLGPAPEGRGQNGVQQGGTTLTPVLPREEPRPGRPDGVWRVGVDGVGGQAQIADRDDPRGAGSDLGPGCVATLVAEGVELLDIAQLEPGLLGDEGPQTQLESAMALRIERAERQTGQGGGDIGDGVMRPNGQHHGLAVADGDDHGRKPDDD